jgi:signal transduction histidine kinase
VESTQLSAFYHSLSSWPKSENELSIAAEKIARLLDAPFAAIVLTAASDRIAYRFTDALSQEKARALAFGEALRHQIRQLGDLGSFHGAGVKQIQIQREGSAFASLVQARYLAISNIFGMAPGAVNSLGRPLSEGKKHMGWITVAIETPLSAKHEVLLMAVTQHLSDLATVADLESAVLLRNQFLSIASHELKTPLTSIYGILQLQERMLRMKKEETAEQQIERQHGFLRMVIRQVERLNELIDGLLDVSRIQSGRFVVEPSSTDVAVILKDIVVNRLAVIAQEAGVTIEIHSPTTLAAWVDPVRIEEVITNLIMNAIRFSPEGGAVRVRLSGEGGSLRISIRDQGPSVPMEDRERIFRPFERAQRTSRLGGLGLGLFISRQIAQLHGGNVSLIESVPGKGNMFEAYFPIKSAALISVSA